MKQLIIILFIFTALLLAAEDIVPFMEAEGIAVINRQDYVPGMIKLFDSARKTIHAVVYQTKYYEEYPDGSNRKMYKAIFDAVKRGVKAEIIVDQSSWNPSHSMDNAEFARFMRSNGVEVYFEPPDKTTHSKIIVVDSLYSVVGSTNWSFYALERNDESAVVVKSAPLAMTYINFYYRLKKFSTEELTINQ